MYLVQVRAKVSGGNEFCGWIRGPSRKFSLLFVYAQLNGMIKDIELVECSGAYMEMLLIVF